VVDLKNLVEPVARGEPTQPLLWTSRRLRNLAKELAKKAHEVCPAVVGNPLRDMGYSLQANRKTRERSRHIDRHRAHVYKLAA
jgi:Rhodopirellula transposase DDE domain